MLKLKKSGLGKNKMPLVDKLPLAALIKQRADEAGGANDLLTFIEIDESGKQFVQYRSYRQLWEKGQALASALHAQGMREGDRLGLMMQNHPEFVDAMVACAILGLVFVPIDPHSNGPKLEYMLTLTGCKGVILGDYCAAALFEAAGKLSDVQFLWVIGKRLPHGVPPGKEIRLMPNVGLESGDGAPTAVEDRLDRMMALLFTSGSTGHPKAIVYTYGRYANSSSHRADYFGLLASDRMYTGLSLTHGNALNVSLGTSLYSNIPLVFSQKFTKNRLWQVIREHRCTTFNLLGGMFTEISATPRKPDDANNPLRLIIGAGMPQKLWQDFEHRFDVQVLEFYGAVEGGLMFNRPGEGPVGSIGKPAPNLYALILDEEGKECPPNVPGRIVFGNRDGSPAQVTYYQNPEASAKKTESGLLQMGDVGYRDEDGWFYFLYRDGGGIRRNGAFVSPAIIELELGKYPDINDVFVYGVPSANDVAGEKDTVAAIQLIQGAQFTPQALWDYCVQHMEKSHIPVYLQIVDEIPKTSSQKPLQQVIAKNFKAADPNVIAFQKRFGSATR